MFTFQTRDAQSSLIDGIYATESAEGGTFISEAVTYWEIVITRQEKQASVIIRGPETIAKPAPIPEYAEFLGIMFNLGTFMPNLPPNRLVDEHIVLPTASHQSFWLDGDTWEVPTFDNVDVFLERIIKRDMLRRDAIVDSTLNNEIPDVSARTLQRRFLKATGMTQGTYQQIQRAQHAVSLLERGYSILDTVYGAGYADQPHLTRSLKRFVGRTPLDVIGNV